MEQEVEVSVVMPCLNEADTIGVCIAKAQAAIARHGLAGEIIVADNGSTDGSREIARQLGARVIPVAERGYGAALMGGIAAARGKYVVMGDADDSYDMGEVPNFVAKLREGYDLVQGCRLPSGGGTVLRGAMPLLHRWWGNPMFTLIARTWFRAPVHDVYCGMRGFRRAFYEGLGQQCTGMEFATEMIIRASMYDARIGEVPITLHPDGRRAHPPHLKTFRDGWRTLRFFLMYSPRWLFFVPGLLLIALGLAGYAIALPGMRIGGVLFGAHTLLVASLAVICGYQTVVFSVIAKAFAIGAGMHPPHSARMTRLFGAVRLETALGTGVAMLVVGLGLILAAVGQWSSRGFGELDYSQTMRWVIPGVTLSTLGVQTIFSSFLLSILGIRRR